jgi:hypothetical protein
MAPKKLFTIQIHNQREQTLYFVLEPMGEVHRIPGGTTYKVVSESASLEVAMDEELISVWGDHYTVYRADGTELATEDQIDIDAERKALPRTSEKLPGMS